eukprot:CAMPEP_0118687620 /NCGR_PEP_ID=MMETSP0800-20121206/8484_1 /TAXON_ID=210618 ORGANISM="Striatella unipunctata, Strain CCMP2910" /NCGR_SAMPLE_ID=MMETSP0800 /ASSEMBLY_ACC=CAM_ASM_000638 /LENGTH=527 /DNA_ID=CAMNT_0006584825 /DNA_START=35 /DNA_END=1618 /DNA_ORIENTATION=+
MAERSNRNNTSAGSSPNEPSSPYHNMGDKGLADLEASSSPRMKPMSIERQQAMAQRESKKFLTGMYIALGAMIGCFFRIILAQLFGEECLNPGTVGWLASGTPLCVSGDGGAHHMNGVIFADLFANLLGSFIMGLMSSGDKLQVPVPGLAVVWLPADHMFQKWSIVHTGIRTGLCGALTTFSSWNSSMIVLLYGTGSDFSIATNYANTFLGYLIGVETALGSYVFGKTAALWIHRYRSPELAAEADAALARKEQGIAINKNLPEFERRYLPKLDVPTPSVDPNAIKYLENWRISTEEGRKFGSHELPFLELVEECMIRDGEEITPAMLERCKLLGYDIKSLDSWMKMRDVQQPSKLETPFEDNLVKNGITPLVVILIGLMLVGLVMIQNEDAYSVTYRTMCFSIGLAPFGALLRWQLSSFNGNVGGAYSWIPMGTLTANLLASVVSIFTLSVDLRAGSEYFWSGATLRAMRIGFSGSLSTVSTFVSEIDGMNKHLPRGHHGYTYILVTLGVSGFTCAILYGFIVYVI